MSRHRHLLFLSILVALVLPALARAAVPTPAAPEAPPRLIALAPGIVQHYSLLEIRGDGLKAWAKGKLVATLDGEFSTPGGQTETRKVEFLVQYRRDGILVGQVDDTLELALGRAHRTFAGSLSVRCEGLCGSTGGLALPGVKLDVFPVTIENAVMFQTAAMAGAPASPVSAMPTWLWYLLISIAAAAFMLLVVFSLFSGVTSFVERRIAGRMQFRIGPNRVGPQGILQFIADAVKAIQKEDMIPVHGSKFLFRIGPYFVVLGVFLTFVTLPFSQFLVVADMNIGIFYILAVTSVVVVGIIVSGWSSNNKWSLLGGFRSAAQMISYEIPAGLAILGVIALAGSMSLQDIIKAQGGEPWNWYLFYNPFTFAAFFFYFTAALAEGNRTPFDLPEAESELVSGYNTEYSGFRFAAFMLAEWGNLYVMSAIATTLFLGGWQIPFVTPNQMETSWALQLAGWVLFTGKVLFLTFVIIWLRWTLPRFRVDQMMNMCWKYLVPLSLVCFLATTAWAAFLPPVVITAGKFLMCGAGLFVLVYFAGRVRHNLRQNEFDIQLQPNA